jgi:hypothetical protein
VRDYNKKGKVDETREDTILPPSLLLLLTVAEATHYSQSPGAAAFVGALDTTEVHPHPPQSNQGKKGAIPLAFCVRLRLLRLSLPYSLACSCIDEVCCGCQFALWIAGVVVVGNGGWDVDVVCV